MMFSSFLSNPFTEKHECRDFVEWHKQIKYYGFWAILIDQPQCVERFFQARHFLKYYLLPGYKRQPHIKIWAAGLMDDAYLSEEQIAAQIESVQTAMEKEPFSLSLANINSFTGSPYLEILDRDGKIGQIRDVLQSSYIEDCPPSQFTPHITLGLYQDAYPTSDVADKMRCFQCASPFNFQVNKISFCAYQTNKIQGTIRALYHVDLNSAEQWLLGA